MRRGRSSARRRRPPPRTELAALMVGRNVQLKVDKEPAKPGEVVLDVQDLTVADETGRLWVNECRSRSARARSSAWRACRATARPSCARRCSGCGPRVRAHPAGRPRPHPQHAPAAAARGRRLHPRGPAGRRPGRRLLGRRQPRPGQLRPAAVRLRHQPAPGRHRQQRGRHGWRSSTSAPSPRETPVGTLSGGNQQKVILARELGREHKVLVASQPTRGLDVARSSSCTAASCGSATTAWPCSSSRPSWTRSTRWRTGSRSCTRAGSPASGRPRCRWRNWAC